MAAKMWSTPRVKSQKSKGKREPGAVEPAVAWRNARGGMLIHTASLGEIECGRNETNGRGQQSICQRGMTKTKKWLGD